MFRCMLKSDRCVQIPIALFMLPCCLFLDFLPFASEVTARSPCVVKHPTNNHDTEYIPGPVIALQSIAGDQSRRVGSLLGRLASTRGLSELDLICSTTKVTQQRERHRCNTENRRGTIDDQRSTHSTAYLLYQVLLGQKKNFDDQQQGGFMPATHDTFPLHNLQECKCRSATPLHLHNSRMHCTMSSSVQWININAIIQATRSETKRPRTDNSHLYVVKPLDSIYSASIPLRAKPDIAIDLAISPFDK
ncbi:hypothetical protein EJ05DRAFT_139476 [Pseudovirgaria hyperparasitica]|uniref:Uncharacterized protein n=1 Tax=Pseudovirgaria hyperparasitica TaxID=470096 RepID=A0A6A6VWZ5_9PEZI|nr:uncharacterized protein EJ05DRAFT_139476 [Pseudovirgaria hyperparasitica]KAF2754369.1 hypothetical protein EJ05DRAFT_139476 [Pseudovirgaria hyperparasitica]